MNKSRSIILLVAVIVTSAWAFREMQIHATSSSSFRSGPDVIVGDIPSIRRWGSIGNESSFSIGTTSCNIGTTRLDWISSTNVHPVISQNLYRVKDGRIEQIGNSWLKHGFAVAAGSLCGTCTDPSGVYLGVGCSDPYGASLNGSQGRLGPRSEINATTGFFPYPFRSLPETGTLDGRIRVADADLEPSLNPNSRYFVESQYVHPQDASSGNDHNNASYREAFVSTPSGNVDINTSSSAPTRREQPAIMAWREVHPDVQVFHVDVPDDGRYVVGVRTTQVGNSFHTEVAVENLTSHQCVRAVKLNCGAGSVSNPGFNDVDYQFEPFSHDDWVPTINNGEVEWATDTFSENENANAIRWSTLYSFWADSDNCPTELTLGLFRPGTVSEVTVNICETVTPDSVELTRGTLGSGGSAEMGDSDDADYVVRRNAQDFQARTEFEIQGTSPSSNPSIMQVTLEAAVFARGNITQKIELFNYNTSSWEEVDSRDAARFTDATAVVTVSGDLSRFVQSGDNSVEARISFESAAQRQQFSSSTDLFSWTIGN